MNTNTIGTLMDTAHNLPTDEFVLGKSRTIPERKKNARMGLEVEMGFEVKVYNF